MALRINDAEYYAIDAHSHLDCRKTPLGHGVASFLGDELVKDLDEVGFDCAVAFPIGASYTDYSEANQIMAEEMTKHPSASSPSVASIPISAPRRRQSRWTAWPR